MSNYVNYFVNLLKISPKSDILLVNINDIRIYITMVRKMGVLQNV